MRRALLIALLAANASGASKWIRISSPSVELFTDSGEAQARAVLKRFEILRGVFRESYLADSSAPLRVFIFASAGEFEKYRPDRNARGFYHAASDQDFIVLYQSISINRFASHEYLHMVMNHASVKLPEWLEEGVPEFYSTLSVNASKMRLGGVIEPNRELLLSQLWLGAEDLALGTPADGRIFYAESWALVHMLSLSPPWNAGMPQFIRLLSQGRDQDGAFLQAFGKSMEDAIDALRLYLRGMKELTLPAPPAEELNIPPPTRLDPVETALALADLALHTGHRNLASSLYSRAARENPQSPAAVAGLGELALAQGLKEDAQRHFERAIAMGAHDPGAYFQLAMLTNDNALLEKAVAVDPGFADAHFLLGVRAADAGNFSPAIEHLRRAVALRPRRFTYWHALGYAQAKSGDRSGAAESARRAALIASNDQEERMAAALTQLAAEPAAAARTRKPDVVTPPSWQNPKGDTRVEGVLKNVDCGASPVRLLVSPRDGNDIELLVRNPSAVELVNAQGVSTILACGAQSLPVTVDYVAATREIARIEFKSVVIMKR